MVLTQEQYESIDRRIVIQARQILVGRRVIGDIFGPVGFGKEVSVYDVLTEIKKGKIDLAWGHGFSEDIPNLTRTKVPIPVLHSEFRINRRHLEASRTEGTPLDLTTVDAAIYSVGLQEDDLIFKGYAADGTNYDINGLYNAAGNNYSTSSDWGTIANILPSINGAVDLLAADNIYPPYNLIVNPIQFNQLFQLVSNTAEWYFTKVKERIQGEIFQTPALSDGNGILVATPGRGFFDLVIGQDMTDESEELEKTKDLWGIIFETLVPRIKVADSVCKLSAI